MQVARASAVIGSVGAVCAFALTGALPAHAASPTYSGRAYAVGISGAKVLGTAIGNTTIADTGQLPAAGGKVSNGPGTFTIPDLGTATVVNEVASGGGSTASASSEISDVAVAPGGKSVLHATLLTAATGVGTCGAKPSVASKVASLTIGGQNVPVPTDPKPNTVVTVEGIISVTFNAQSYDAATNTQSASALVISVPDVSLAEAAPQQSEQRQLFSGTITISHAESDLEGCPQAVQAATVTVPNTGSAVPARVAMLLLPAGVVLTVLAVTGLRRRADLR